MLWARQPSRNPSWPSTALCRRCVLRSPDSERFRAIPVPKDDSHQLDLVHRRLSHKLSHPQFFLCGIHCRIEVIPDRLQDPGDLPRRLLRLLGAGKPVPIACRPTQLLRSGSQGCQSRDRSMSRLFTAGLRAWSRFSTVQSTANGRDCRLILEGGSVTT